MSYQPLEPLEEGEAAVATPAPAAGAAQDINPVFAHRSSFECIAGQRLTDRMLSESLSFQV